MHKVTINSIIIEEITLRLHPSALPLHQIWYKSKRAPFLRYFHIITNIYLISIIQGCIPHDTVILKPNMLLAIGSITKNFVATLRLKLVEEDEIAVNSIGDIPEY